jgi:hypothetical protein
MLNLDFFPKTEWYKYEDYTNRQEILCSLISSVLPEEFLELTQGLDMRKGDRHHHRSKRMTNQDMAKLLNGGFGFLEHLISYLQSELLNNGIDLEKVYGRLGYDLMGTVREFAREN